MVGRKFPDVTCPCGSGRKFAVCCSSRQFGDNGGDALGAVLTYQRREFFNKNGREPRANDLVFFDVPEPPAPPTIWERIRAKVIFCLAWLLWMVVMVPGMALTWPLYFKHRGKREEEIFWWAAYICGTLILVVAFLVFVIWGLWLLFSRL
jgi:hypothetical protein